MKRKFIFKLIAGSVVSTTLFTGMPLQANGAWKQDNYGNYYYDEGNGYSAGWRNIDGSVYFFDNNGVMQKGWINYDNAWYFLDNYGVLKTGWINYNNSWYYSDSAGIMQTGIINVNGSTYYLGDNGVMQTKNVIIDGQFYTIGSNGVVAGSRVPSPDKVFDTYGNCIQNNGTNNDNISSPIEQTHMQEMKDESEIGDYDAPTRKFTVKFRDYDGEELESKSVKEGSNVKVIDADSREGYDFIEWNTKSDGSGKAYDEGDKVKVTSDLNLYAIYKRQDEINLVNSITISGDKSVEIGNEIQLSASVKPDSATNTEVEWSVENGTGEATVDRNGNVKGVKLGTIKVIAKAKDGSGKSDEYEMSVVAAKTLVTSIKLSTDSESKNKISENGGTLQLVAEIAPQNADNKQLTWSIVDKNGNKVAGKATVDENGLVQAIANTDSETPIYVMATAKDGSGTRSNKYEITITNQTAKVDNITIKSNSNYVVIKDGGKLQLKAVDNNGSEVNAEWSVKNSDDTTDHRAQIDENGVVTGISAGKVTVTATYGGKTATKNLQVIQPSTHIEITAKDSAGKDTPLVINTSGGSLNLVAKLLGENNVLASNQSVTWSIDDTYTGDGKLGEATIGHSSGKLTATRNGNVRVIAHSLDPYNIGETTTGSAIIVISNQKIPVDKINLFKEENGNKSDVTEGSVLMHVGGATTESQVIISAEATAKQDGDTPDNKSVKWTFADGTTSNHYAKIEQVDAADPNKIKITALNPGTITLNATAADNPGKTQSVTIVIKKYITAITFVPETIDVTAAGSSAKTVTVEAIVDGVDLTDTNNITNSLYKWSIDSSFVHNATVASEYSNLTPKVKNGQLMISNIINIKNPAESVVLNLVAEDGSGKSAKQIINIKPRPNDIVINGEKTIKAGQSLELSAIVEGEDKNSNTKPIQKVIWSIPTTNNNNQNEDGEKIISGNDSTNNKYTITCLNPGKETKIVTIMAKSAEDNGIIGKIDIQVEPKMVETSTSESNSDSE